MDQQHTGQDNMEQASNQEATTTPARISEGVLGALDLQRVHFVQHRSGIGPTQRSLLELCLDHLMQNAASN